MASVNLAGTIRDPNAFFSVSDKFKFVSNKPSEEVMANSYDELIIPNDGTYDIDLQHGSYDIFYSVAKAGSTQKIKTVTVDGSTTATTLPELING
jgi:hypothetical protein